MENEELKKEIKKIFERTGLVTNVQIKGMLYDEENPLRLEYRIEDTSHSKEKNRAKIRLFKTNLVRRLLNNYSLIQEILGEDHKSGFCIERIMVNPDIPKPDESKAEYSILQTIKKELENYAMQTRH
ncbi:MAG: hypothetical protein Q8N63_07745 [Nanoarchaeota archaeon]|nr:hypothetical protein [Nanoarchaeota archaeon]